MSVAVPANLTFRVTTSAPPDMAPQDDEAGVWSRSPGSLFAAGGGSRRRRQPAERAGAFRRRGNGNLARVSYLGSFSIPGTYVRSTSVVRVHVLQLATNGTVNSLDW
jgi:hypothetical protein